MATRNSSLNMDTLTWRLAETIAWSTRHGSITDAASAATKLRTPQLCPTGFIYTTNIHGYTCMEPSLGSQKSEALKEVVERVAKLRADQLKLSNSYPLAPAQHLAGGRLLCYAPYENLAEGVEEQETQGYFDVNAVPPWDTWLWFVTQQAREQNRPYLWYDTYLISWVPPELVDAVDKGAVATSTTHALEWADELELGAFRAASSHSAFGCCSHYLAALRGDLIKARNSFAIAVG